MAEGLGPTETQCSNCNAWVPLDGGLSGYCQAHPPVPTFGAHFKQPGPGVPELAFYFPITAADEWCREFQKIVITPP